MKQKTELFYDEAGDLLELFVGEPTDGYYDEMEDGGLFIGRAEKTEEIIGFKLFAFKKRLEKNLHVVYDKKKDILAITVGKPTETDERELSDRVFIHINKTTKELEGFIILDFKKRLTRLNFYDDIPVEEPPLSL